MNLIDAIKQSNGRPFKLPQMNQYLYTKGEFMHWTDTNNVCGTISVPALIAEDWEFMTVPDNIIEFKPKVSNVLAFRKELK